MPIKGKKKAQRRGSQARRRPAQAPRPAPPAPRRPPWYRTPVGQMFGGVILILVVGLLIAWIVNVRADAADRAERREALEQYTSQVRVVLTQVADVARDMVAAPVTTEGADLRELERNARRWREDLQAAVGQVGALLPPAGLEGASKVYEQSVAAYLSAANTYGMVIESEDPDLAELILIRANEQRDRATALFQAANETLDSERVEAGLEQSDLTAPTAGASPPALPSPEPTEGGQGGGGGSESDGGRTGGGNRGGGTDDDG